MTGSAAPPDAVLEPTTRIAVLGAEGFPEGSVLSVRAGGFKRQRPLSRCTEPFVFRGSKAAARPLQVDVLVPAATSGDLGDLGEGRHQVKFQPRGACTGLSTEAMSLELQIGQVCGDAAAAATSVALAERPGTAAKVQSYMDGHALKDRLTHALMQLLREQPEDPMGFLSSAFCKGEDIIMGRDSSRRNSHPEEPIQVRVGDSMHVLPPCVTLGAPTRLLDFGSGETGFNTYSMGEQGDKLFFRGNKRKAPFFAAFVEPHRVEDFGEALIEEFELAAASEKKLRIFAGATGLHRELLANSENASKAQQFLGAVERHLTLKLGRPSRIWLFVPSGLLEAQFELYATEWLVGRSHLLDLSNDAKDKGLTESLVHEAFRQLDCNGSGTLNTEDVEQLMSRKPTTPDASPKSHAVHKTVSDLVAENGQLTIDQFHESLKRSVSLQMAVQTMIFSGTLSAGGGSSQLSMMGPTSNSALQLFSVPVGNRVPIVEGLFSKPVLDSERQNWALRVRSELRQASFPCGVRGMFVGISAAYYAVKAAGVADRVIGLHTVLEALKRALQTVDPEDDRTIANLTLIHELMEWCFDESACFVFKRQWKTGDGEFVSTWTLGLFTQQHTMKTNQDKQARPRRKGDIWKSAASKVAAPLNVATSRRILQDEAGRTKMDSMFEVPFVAWPLYKTHLLDLGSGEVGLYAFEADLVHKMVLATNDRKVPEAFFDSFVKNNRVGDFATVLIDEFKLAPDRARRREIIAGGATGLHREMLLSDKIKRDQIFSFIAQVEGEISKRIERLTCIRLFVPSGELEAQFELRAVQWLIGVPEIDIQACRLPDWMLGQAWDALTVASNSPSASVDVDVATDKLSALGVEASEAKAVLARADANADQQLTYPEFLVAASTEPALQAMIRRCTFCGTISAGGGSSQLTLASCRESLSQLFSMPVGNRVPSVQRLFADEVTWQQRSDWIERIRGGLRSSQFPKGLGGFFVGISAMYHAAKAAGIADRLVMPTEAIDALAAKLATLDPKDHRNIANLTLVKEIITWVFSHTSAVLLFKRNWSTPSASYVAGWTLGMYCTQFQGDEEVRARSVVIIQKITRGRQVRKRCGPRRSATLDAPPPADVFSQTM